MQLDRISVALRAREPWEAVDLGAVMLRAWWRPIYGTLLAVLLPVTLVLHALLLQWPWAALLLTWWLKPLYDRIVLHLSARAVFGDTPSIRETLANSGLWLRQTGLIGALTWRRFEIARSFNLAVRQLEGQAGAAARERERVLGRRSAGQASGLLYACLMFELVVTLSLSAGVDLVTPAGLDSDHGARALFGYWFGQGAPGWTVYLNNAFMITAMFLIEPLYVAGGFALYLNRRTLLEAWDLELNFRRMRERDAPAGRQAAAILLCTVLAGSAGMMPDSAQAAAPSSRQIIREVLAAPEFQEYRTETTWQRRPADNPTARTESWAGLARLLEALSLSLAQLARFGAYLLLAVGAFFVLRYLLRELLAWQRQPRDSGDDPEPPAILFGLDVRPESLPADLADLAAASARSNPRLALSLLYRGALATLIHRDRLRVANGDTEGDCVRNVQDSGRPQLAGYFARLVAAWSQLAYGEHVPDPGLIERLCAEWPQHFSAAGAASA